MPLPYFTRTFTGNCSSVEPLVRTVYVIAAEEKFHVQITRALLRCLSYVVSGEQDDPIRRAVGAEIARRLERAAM